MAMIISVWMQDAPFAESEVTQERVAAWEILDTATRLLARYPDACYLTLAHTSRQRGEWVIWVTPNPTIRRTLNCQALGKLLSL